MAFRSTPGEHYLSSIQTLLIKLQSFPCFKLDFLHARTSNQTNKHIFEGFNAETF